MTYSPRVMTEWRQSPKVSPSTSPSPPTTPTSSPLAWRRRSSSSSNTSSSSSGWRTGSPPRPISNQAGKPPFSSLKDGDILYLPSKPIPSSSIIRQHPNQSNFEDHPLVVLGTRIENGEEIVSFRQLTTFGGIPVETKKPNHQQHFFMLCENHQDMETRLVNPIAYMALGFEPLPKRSYINLSYNSRFEIEYKYLEAFTTSGLRRLDAKSVSFIKNVPSST